MSSNFLNNLNGILSATSTANTTFPACTDDIDHYTYYQMAIIPAACITLLFAMSKKRKNVLKGFLSGRPALIYPMDSLTRSSRLSYACAFGATAYLIYQIVLHRSYAIDTSDMGRAAKSFIALLSMIVYGMVYFPLFATQALGSVLGYAIGSLYVWMLTVVEIYRLTLCKTSTSNRILLVFRGLPSLLCLLYLSIIFPIRMVQSFRARKFFFWNEDNDMDMNTLQDIHESYTGHHVIKLLTKSQGIKRYSPPFASGEDVIQFGEEEAPAGKTLKARLIHLAVTGFHRFVYKRKRGFRYSSRIISVIFVATLVIYTLTLEILALIPKVFNDLMDGVLEYMDSTVGLDDLPTDTSETIAIRDGLWATWWILDVTKICFIVATVVATVIALFNVLHTLSSYRANLLALYRGDHSHIPEAQKYGYVTNCVNSIKYAGFQVGYIIWAYILLVIILSLIACILAIIIILLKYEFTDWFIVLLEYAWPIALAAAIVAVTQILLCKFVFLQENGRYQSLNNRSFYFNFTYFMFFYNIFLGLVSCLLRILKAMFTGILFLSRLDNSTLPRKFEFIDPGFKAYVGFMHIEEVHTHPVVIVFARLMLLGLKNKKEREEALVDTLRLNPTGAQDTILTEEKKNGTTGALGAETDINNLKETHAYQKMVEAEEERHRRSVAARSNWHVFYTLLMNPDIRITRKGYLQMLKKAKELGVRIPVSDRQADVNLDELQRNLARAEGMTAGEPAEKDPECGIPSGEAPGSTDIRKNGMDGGVKGRQNTKMAFVEEGKGRRNRTTKEDGDASTTVGKITPVQM